MTEPITTDPRSPHRVAQGYPQAIAGFAATAVADDHPTQAGDSATTTPSPSGVCCPLMMDNDRSERGVLGRFAALRGWGVCS